MYLGSIRNTPPLVGTGTTSVPQVPTRKPILDRILDTVPTLATQVLSVINQQKLAKLNLQRMRQGLAPLSSTEIQAFAPKAQVEVGMSPQTRNLIIAGAIGVGVVVLLATRGRR